MNRAWLVPQAGIHDQLFADRFTTPRRLDQDSRSRLSAPSAPLVSGRPEPGEGHVQHHGSQPESYAVLIASTRLRAFSLVTIVVR
jgi:hypothetical protein